jgi:hypothetical protein
VEDAGKAADALADAGRTAGTAAGKAASHVDDAAGLAGRIRITTDSVDAIRHRTPEARQRALGADPDTGYRPYEGEVGALIEDWCGGLERSPDRGADWIGTSGPYTGKTFDLIGLPPGASFITTFWFLDRETWITIPSTYLITHIASLIVFPEMS